MAYIPTPDYKTELSRLDNMVIGLTSAVVLLYGAIAEPDGAGIVPPEPPSHINQMSDRLSRLEGAFDWMKITISIIAAVVIGGIAFIGVQITRVDGRISTVSDKVDALPDKMNANLRELTNTLA